MRCNCQQEIPMHQAPAASRFLIAALAGFTRFAVGAATGPARHAATPTRPCAARRRAEPAGYLARRTRASSSRIRQTAPMVMAPSAMLNAGKCQLP